MTFETYALSLPFTHAHFYNEPNGATTIVDHVGGSGLLIGSGATLGAPGLIANDAITCCNLSNPQITDPTNAYSPAFNESWSQVFIFNSSNARSGTQSQYSLVGNLNPSAPYDGFDLQLDYGDTNLYTRDTNKIPAWMACRGYFSDGTNSVNAMGLCNVSNSVVNVVAFTYQYIAGSTNTITNSVYNVWLNGSLVCTNLSGPGPTSSIGPSRTTYVWAGGSAGGGAPQYFNGQAQFSGVARGTILSETQIKTLTNLALYGVTPPAGAWLNSTKGFDTAGNNLQISNPAIVYSAGSGLYYVYGMATGGVADVLNGLNWDMQTTQVACYSSPNLAYGSFSPVGIAFDASSAAANPVGWALQRSGPFPIPNPVTGLWTMAGHWVPASTYAGASLFIATSTTPQLPYAYQASGLLPSGETSVADNSVYVAEDGKSGYLCYANTSNGAIRVVAFNSAWNAFSGSPVTVASGQAVEGPCMFDRKGVTFVVASSQEFYNGANVSNVVYFTSTTGALGTYSGSQTATISSLQGSPLNFQTGTVFRSPVDPSRYFLLGDYWFNGWLERSSVVIGEIMFPTDTTMIVVIAPSLLLGSEGSTGGGGPVFIES